jgi:hypothetical protein
MITRLGDAATDNATLDADPFMIGLTNSNALSDLATNAPTPNMSTSDLLAWGAYAGQQQTSLNNSAAPASNYTVTPSGQVVNTGTSLTSALSSLFGGASSVSYNTPKTATSASAAGTSGISNSTIEWIVIGIGAIAILGIITSGRKK